MFTITKIKRRLRIKKLNYLQNSYKTWMYADFVELSRLTESSKTIVSVQSINEGIL